MDSPKAGIALAPAGIQGSSYYNLHAAQLRYSATTTDYHQSQGNSNFGRVHRLEF